MVGVALAAPAPSPTAAAEATASGWWTTSPVALAPDAQGALVVQGGPQAGQPQSYAAVEFALGTGEAPARLLLSVAPGSGSTSGATLTFCPLTTAFTPADGGAMADAPPYDCTRSATAVADAAGGYTVDVTALGHTTLLALAILPGAVTDRVVLTKPTGTSLDTVRTDTSEGAAAGAGGGLGPAGDGAVRDPSIVTGGPAAPSTWPFEADPFGPPLADLPAGAEQATRSVTSAPSAPTEVVPSTTGLTAATREGRRGTPLAAIVVGSLAVLAAGLWLTAGRMAEVPGSA